MDFYILLGVERAATQSEIKRAYRRLARRYHPDLNPGDQLAAARFGEIVRAYETLSDPERRRRYDQFGYEPAAPEPATGFAGFDFSATVHSVSQSTFGDLFEKVFRGAPVTVRRPERGADLHASLTLGFNQALAGGRFDVTVVRQETCVQCAGAGTTPTAPAPCPTCTGTGMTRSARGHMLFTRPCMRCRGTGSLAEQNCQGCAGAGVASRSERVGVNVPPGTADGARLRVPERGNAGRFGGPPGDLYVDVSVTPHPLFRREGDDLHLVVPIAVHEAALGARIEIPGGDGPARLRVPPGTQSGQRLRLRGRGAPGRNGERGDLVVEVRVMLPRVLDERSRELLRQFGEINGAAGVREHFDRQWRPEAADAPGDGSRR